MRKRGHQICLIRFFYAHDAQVILLSMTTMTSIAMDCICSHFILLVGDVLVRLLIAILRRVMLYFTC